MVKEGWKQSYQINNIAKSLQESIKYSRFYGNYFQLSSYPPTNNNNGKDTKLEISVTKCQTSQVLIWTSFLAMDTKRQKEKEKLKFLQNVNKPTADGIQSAVCKKYQTLS